MNYFDTHCHLQDKRLDNIREELLIRAEDSGVKKMLCCGTHEGDWQKVIRFSDSHSSVLPALGVHPWFINSLDSQWFNHLEKLIGESCCAVGEIGLDFLQGKKDQSLQEKVFIRQLRLAKKYNRPLSVHCRKAWQRMIDILKAENPFKSGVVIHSFSGSVEVLKILEKLGCYISFSGSVTKTNNKKVKKAVTHVSMERILLETDSPDIQPEGYENELNEPANIRFIMASVSKLRNLPESVLAEKIFLNSIKLFG